MPETVNTDGKVTVINFYEHQKYAHMYQDWKKYYDLINADDNTIKSTKYLWLHTIEDCDRCQDDQQRKLASQDRALREQRTQYYNWLQMVVNRFVSLLMKGGLNVVQAKEIFGDNFNNVDGEKTGFEDFVRQLVEDIIVYGVGYVQTDTATIQARNILDEQESGSRPYWIKITPLDLKDWEIGANGDYEKFRYEYELVKKRENLYDEPEVVKYCTVCCMVNNEDGNQVYRIETFISSAKRF